MSISKKLADRIIDVSGLHCPQPIIHCKAAINLLNNGEILHLISTEPDMQREVSLLMKTSGNELLRCEYINQHYHFHIMKQQNHKKNVRSASHGINNNWLASSSNLCPAPC